MRRRVEMNFADRAIAWAAPELALRRLAARTALSALDGGYNSGRKGRRATQEWNPGGGSADADIVPDLPDLRARSRDAERNVPIAAAALGRPTTLAIGSGLQPMPQIDRKFLRLDDEDADAIEEQIAREFELWACSKNCDASRSQDFYGLQRLGFLGTLQSGDCFAVRRTVARPGWPHELAWQFFEADQVSNPVGLRDGGQLEETGNRVVAGVEIDDMNAPVAYHFQTRHPGDIGLPGKFQWTRLPAYGAASGEPNLLHLWERRRIGATRGVPFLAPVLELLKQLGRYSEAELMAAVINSCFAITTKTDTGAGIGLERSSSSDGKNDQIRITEPGAIVDLLPNEVVEAFTPARPSANFDPFFVSIVRQIGAVLEIPFEVLMEHFTASYSASRAALEMAWQFIRDRRNWIVGVFCRPSYELVVAGAAARGRLEMPGFFDDPLMRQAWLGCDWVGPGRISVDPLKENNADVIAEDRGWKTAAENTAEKTGGDWESKYRQRVKEQRMRREGELLPAPPGAPPAQQPSNEPAPEPGSDREDT